MAIPVGYRQITSDDVGKTFGVDLETVIRFDDTVSVGNWYINAEPPFDYILWMELSDSSYFDSDRGGNPGSWMIDTYFRGSTQSMSEGSYPNPYDTIVYTSETVPSGIIIVDLWTLDTTWMNYVYVKDKEPDPEYTITFDGRGGSSPSSQTTTNQKLTTLPSSTKIGYKFLGWYTSSYGGTIITTSTVFSTNRAVWAQWTLEDYKINFYDYNNVLVESFIEQYYGDSITLPTPLTRPGYTFDGWYDNRTGTTYHGYNGSGTKITWTIVPDLGGSGQEYNFYAKYTPKVYDLYYSHGSYHYSPVTYNEPYNKPVLNSEPYSREGYTWVGWYDALSGGNKITSTSLVKVVTTNSYIYAYARWTQDSVYTITFSDTKGNSTTREISSPQNYKVNPLPSASANGYQFQGWYTAASGGTRITTNTVFNANTTVYARWLSTTYTVTYDANGGTTVPTISGITALPTPLPTPTRTGYDFVGWCYDTLLLNSASAGAALTSNITLYADWAIKTYTVKFFNSNSVQIGNPQIINHGGNATAPEDPTKDSTSQYNYTFSGWDKAFTNVTQNLDITAKYTETVRSYEIGWKANGGKFSNNNTILTTNHNYGTIPEPNLTLSRDSTAQYHYNTYGWTPPITPVIEEKVYEADWESYKELRSYTITWNGGPGNTLDYPTSIVEYGTKPTPPGGTKTGYDLVFWSPPIVAVTEAKEYTAYWTPKTYSIAYDLNGGINNSGNPSTYNVETPSITFLAPTRVGYNFNGWSITGVSKGSTGNKTTTANWTPTTYSITYNLKGGTNVSGNPSTYNIESSSITFLAPTRVGYNFNGWSITNIPKGSTGNKTTTANWIPKKYIITWSGGPGSTLDYSTSSVEYGTTPTPPGRTKTGYDFVRWSPTIVAVTGATTYTAIWTIKTYTVRFFNYNSVQIGDEQIINHGGNATAPANPTKPQTTTHTYTFSGWNKEFTNVTQNLDITATYTSASRKYTITWIRNDGTGLSETTQVYYGAEPTPPEFKRTGYTLSGWTPVTAPVLGEATYTAQWTLIQYNITYILNGGTNVSGNPSTYNVETPLITFLPPTKTGYDFVSWSITHISKGSTGDTTTTANWTPTTYSITYYLNGGTNNLGNPSTYNIESSSITFLPPTKTGYDFNGWTTTNIPKGSTGNKTTTANWIPKKYTITWSGGVGSTLDYSTSSVEYGTVPTPPGRTKTGYDFVRWSPTIVAVTGATTYTAIWTVIEYTITYILDGGINNLGNPSTYKVTTPSFDFLEPTKAGYDFNGWSITNIPTGSTGDKTTTASWTPITYSINYELDGGINNLNNPSTYNVETPSFTFLEPTKTGYDFNGWTITGVSKGSTGDKTTTASWTPTTYSITYNLKGGANVSGNPSTYNIESSSITFLAPTRVGYNFNGWSITNIPKGSTGNKTTTANWIPKKYIITWSGGPGSTLDYSTSSVEYGTTPTPPGRTKTGYDFVRWSPTIVAVTGATTYTAIWTIKTYTVRFFNYNSVQIGDEQIINHGGNATAPANPTKPQTTTHTYTFSGWNKEFTSVTQDLDIIATYTEAPRKYTITWIWNNGTGFLTTKQEYYGADPTPPSLQRAGYTLSDWTPKVVPVLGEATYTAKWTIIQYNINYILNGGINVSGNPSTYNVETPLITFLPPTKTGYDFVSWSTTNIPKGSTGDKTTTASWKFINVPNLNSIANDCAFNNNDQYLVVAHETTPYVTIYKKGTNDTFSKMNLTAPPGKAKSCAFSPDGRYLAIGHQIAPGLTIYKKGTGDSFNKLTISSIEQNTALSCTFSKDNKYLAVTHLSAPHVTIYEIGQADMFTKINALSSPDGDQGSGSSSSFSNENEYLAITYNNSPYVAVIKAQRNPNEKHTFLLNNSFSTVSERLDTPLIGLGYASESGSPLQNNKRVKLIWK